MKYMLFDGLEIRQDKVIKGDNGKAMIFPTEKVAKEYANQLGLNPYTVSTTIESNFEDN